MWLGRLMRLDWVMNRVEQLTSSPPPRLVWVSPLANRFQKLVCVQFSFLADSTRFEPYL
jgi:hypothetical protein